MLFVLACVCLAVPAENCFGEDVSSSDMQTFTDESAVNVADGYDILGGTWSVGGVLYNGSLYDVHDVEGLEDLYDSTSLWFDENGDFGYMNFYHDCGSYVPFKDKEYLLKTQSVYFYRIEDEQIVQEEIVSDKKTTYVVELIGDAYTLCFGALDPITGKIKADSTPLLFVKDGYESSYIAKYKVSASKSNQSSNNKNSNTSNVGTIGERNALKRAKEYLSVIPFSYTGLIEQLEFEGFTHSEATYGADYCNANWNTQAAKKAADYLEIYSFSRSGLIDQLEYDGFTHDQAVYGVERNGY